MTVVFIDPGEFIPACPATSAFTSATNEMTLHTGADVRIDDLADWPTPVGAARPADVTAAPCAVPIWRDADGVGDDPTSAYHEVLRRAFGIAGDTGERCRPVHLLAALSGLSGPIGDALRTPIGAPLWHGAIDTAGRGGSASYLVMPTQEAARQLAASRGEPTRPEHLLLAIIDQGEPEAMTPLTDAGIDIAALRALALQLVGVPGDLPPITVPDAVPAGTMDRPPLPVGELDPRAWAVLDWRQRHLPLQRLRRRSHYAALCHLERRAAWRIASQLGVDADQRYSLSRHHLDRVEQLVAQASPDLVGQRTGPHTGRPTVTVGHAIVGPGAAKRRLHRKRFGFTVGWGTWFSNRRVGLRNRWFWFRTARHYRGVPPI